MTKTVEHGRRSHEFPPPLPPETRTVGQLVAEAIRYYGRRFWASLALGLPPASLVVAEAPLTQLERLVLLVTAGSILLTASYVAACALVAEERRGGPGGGLSAGPPRFFAGSVLWNALLPPR